jgi:hypothetical protein
MVEIPILFIKTMLWKDCGVRAEIGLVATDERDPSQ